MHARVIKSLKNARVEDNARESVPNLMLSVPVGTNRGLSRIIVFEPIDNPGAIRFVARKKGMIGRCT
jgi:hypothetical protein